VPAVSGSAHAHLMQRVGNDVLPGDKPGQHPLGCPAEQVADAPRQAAAHNDEGVVRQLAAMIPTFTPTRENLKL